MTYSDNKNKRKIPSGKIALGIELGSTRIKSVLIDETMEPIASGNIEWENQLVDKIWTYSLEAIWDGIQASYQKMATDFYESYGKPLKKIDSIGISAMMHGYLVFDSDNDLLIPFRTWRNTMTEEAEKKLTISFEYNVPQRWSISHLYQAILNKEEHLSDINYMTTLAGYVHWKLTGEKVIGIGDASGMFPINIKTKNYDESKINKFYDLVCKEDVNLDLHAIMPKILIAGDYAGRLTEEGAYLLDPSGILESGSIFCPPEGDAGTGMVATNSVTKKTGNISAGTSAFAMIVLEKELKKVHREIDLVTTPAGDLVAMVHTNNCSSDINAWVKIFKEFSQLLDITVSDEKLYQILFNESLLGSDDCGGLLSYGYYSGENITEISEGRPLFIRTPESEFNLANFMRLHISSAFGAMSVGMEILKEEDVKIDKLVAHGGLFKTPKVAQKILAAAMEAPVTIMKNASEGGAWGIAILAKYTHYKDDYSLTAFLDQKVFNNNESTTLKPTNEDIEGYHKFRKRYENGLPIEQMAKDYLQ